MSRWLLLALAGALPTTGALQLRTVGLGELKVTEGVIGPSPAHGMSIAVPKVRAELADPTTQAAELRFRYLGPTETISPLDDGENRAQLGLKLRAADACNVVYVMWRLAPRSELAVQVKLNPGEHTSRACGARGYRKLPVKVSLPELEPGAEHVLRADLRGDALEVRVDGKVAWRGALGPGPVPLAGPAGLRTDNVRVDFELAVDGAAAPKAVAP